MPNKSLRIKENPKFEMLNPKPRKIIAGKFAAKHSYKVINFVLQKS